MAKQRYINTHFWDDSYIKKLDIGAKFLFIYLLTSPLANIAGAYEITLERICFDTGLEESKVIEYLAEFERAEKVFFKNDWILIQNFIKNQSKNPKIIAGIESLVKCCPDWVKDRLSISYESLSHLNLNYNINNNSNRNRKKKTTEANASSSAPSDSQSKGVREIFEFWKETLNHPSMSLDGTRARKIKERLKEFSVEDLKSAIRNVRADDWRMAQAQRHEIKVIFRDKPQVENFLEKTYAPPPTSSADFVDPFSGGILV